MLDPEHETYIVYVGSVSSVALSSSSPLEFDVHSFCRLQISGLIIKEASIKFPDKYVDFIDLFSPDLASELPKNTKINDHAIKLVDDQSPSYGPIYSLRPVNIEILKAYMKTNLVNKFIRLSKSPAGISVLFNRKLDSFHQLCVNYRGLNNLMIKNRYLLLLIGELLDKLRRAK